MRFALPHALNMAQQCLQCIVALRWGSFLGNLIADSSDQCGDGRRNRVGPGPQFSNDALSSQHFLRSKCLSAWTMIDHIRVLEYPGPAILPASLFLHVCLVACVGVFVEDVSCGMMEKPFTVQGVLQPFWMCGMWSVSFLLKRACEIEMSIVGTLTVLAGRTAILLTA